jgi:hypothetical protein
MKEKRFITFARGIPEALRGEVWQRLTGASMQQVRPYCPPAEDWFTQPVVQYKISLLLLSTVIRKIILLKRTRKSIFYQDWSLKLLFQNFDLCLIFSEMVSPKVAIRGA